MRDLDDRGLLERTLVVVASEFSRDMIIEGIPGSNARDQSRAKTDAWKEMVHYGFSKSAQLTIARGAAETTKGTNVTVNSVMPGPTWVEMQPVRLGARAKAQGTTVEELAARTFTERRTASLLQRYATPEEVANLTCYVCSKASSATNGAALRVDGDRDQPVLRIAR